MVEPSPPLRKSTNRLVAAATAVDLGLSIAPVLAAEQAVPAEKNPPGDIPDTQVFIDYASPAGFAMKVPEGWARTDRADGASFVDKLDGVVLTITKADAAPTVEIAKK